MTLTGTATFLLAASNCSGGGESAATSPPPAPAAASRVVFFAEGTGTKAGSVTMKTESGGTIQKDVKLPMGNAETGEPGVPSDAFKTGDFLYLSLQNHEETGSVTCRIKVGDTVIDEATSSGSHVVVTCQGTMP